MTLAQAKANVAELARRLVLRPAGTAEIDIVREWYFEIAATCSSEVAELAFNTLETHRLRSGSTTYIGAIHVDASQKAGGDIIASVAGIGNTATIENISVYKSRLDQSRLSPELKSALIESRDGLDRLAMADSIKQAVASEFEKFSTELEKPAPEKGILRKAWDGMIVVAKGIPSIAMVAKLVLKFHGIDLPIP